LILLELNLDQKIWKFGKTKALIECLFFCKNYFPPNAKKKHLDKPVRLAQSGGTETGAAPMFKYLKPNGKIDRNATAQIEARISAAPDGDTKRRWTAELNSMIDLELVAFAKAFPNRPESRDDFFALIEGEEFDPKRTPAQCAQDIIEGFFDPPKQILCASLGRPTTDITAQVARFVFDWLDGQLQLGDIHRTMTVWLETNGCEVSDRLDEIDVDIKREDMLQAQLESSARWATR
jgi:hypothetical protein